ncbi:hypothetical protein O181_064746 [Austropuccinia psidii MF-1]|uniref:DUF4939 domain-containing protein n=1 Tax=Austropuccinia psidii MF-1 TaxID=1389203 RepID=A0A9Q3EMM1_9BASI|nr:hypothetical protein [Austropuccinia psidii MF-1]
MEGVAPSRREERGPRRSSSFSGVAGRFPGLSRTNLKGPVEDGEEEEEESDGTEGVPAPSEPSLLAIMQHMIQIMANLQAASSSKSSILSAFKTPSMKAPECSHGTHPFKVRSFIQSCQLIFHNDPSNVSQDREKVLYDTSFLIGRAAKWIELYLSNLTNQDSNYLLNSWNLFESQLCTLFGDPNKVRKAEAEMDSGEDFPSLNALHTQGPGVVPMWYNIPFCTILSQQSNGDTFRTQLRDFKLRHKSIIIFEGGLFSHSLGQFPGGYQETIQGPQSPGLVGVWLSILTRTIL